MPSTKRVSHRGSLLKGVAVYRVLYQSILNAKLTGRKNLGRKRCTSNRDDWKLENTVKQSWFKHLWELHKEWTEAGVSASRVTTLRRLQEKGYQATSEPETTSEASYLSCGEKELSGPKSSFQMKVNFAFHLEIKVPESGWRVERHRIHVAWSPVWSFHSQWWFGLPCHCWCWSTVFSEVHSQRSHLQEILEHFMLPSADKLYGDADFIFQQHLAPAHTAKGTKSWFNDHGITVLDWPAKSPDLNPIENLSGIVKRKMRDTRPNNADELKAIWWIGGFVLNVSLNITIKRTKDLNYFSLCALNLFNTRVSQFELNYWNKWTFPRHSNLLRCTCIYCMCVCVYIYIYMQLNTQLT